MVVQVHVANESEGVFGVMIKSPWPINCSFAPVPDVTKLSLKGRGSSWGNLYLKPICMGAAWMHGTFPGF